MNDAQVIRLLLKWVAFIVTTLILPPIVIGYVRKRKARLQNRLGAPYWQPLFDLIKFLGKGETVSILTSWVFRSTAVINLAALLLLSLLIPWLSFKPVIYGGDLFLVIYLLALTRFLTVVAALDSGSPFSGFGASREVTVAFLVEPATMLCLVALGALTGKSDLAAIFAYPNPQMETFGSAWLLAGTGLFLASLVELSRMPVDDPTTHLELTMIHEAMILENSGKNLALVEYTHYLRMSILLGLAGQCFMHAIPSLAHAGSIVLAVASILSIFALTSIIVLIEGTQVKLRWTKIPEFIAYSVAMGLLCAFIAVGKGMF